MSKEQIMYRLLAMETNINQMRLRSGKLYQNDWLKLNKIIKIMSKLPLFIDDTAFIDSGYSIKKKKPSFSNKTKWTNRDRLSSIDE
jgi:replicative DNA helicase